MSSTFVVEVLGTSVSLPKGTKQNIRVGTLVEVAVDAALEQHPNTLRDRLDPDEDGLRVMMDGEHVVSRLSLVDLRRSVHLIEPATDQ